MAAEKIGNARCPLCGGTASVSLSKSQLPVLTMNCCQAQLFTRSDRSDMLVRALMLPATKAADPAPADPPAAPAPVATRTAPAVPKTPDPEPAPVRTEKRSPFALLGS